MHNCVTSHLGSSPPCTRHPIHACAPVCCVVVVFSSTVSVLYFVPPLCFQPFQMFTSVFNERFRSNTLCDFRLGTVATSDHETPLTGGPGEVQNTKSRMRRTRRRSKPRRIRISNALQREISSRRKSSRTSLHEDKSMLKHIMKKCKVVNYVDTETSSGTQISPRRSSRTTPARLHRACTVERLNSNVEELTKHNTADLFTKH